MANILTDSEYQGSAALTLQRCLEAGLVEDKDRSFVKSLLSQYDHKGHLSPKQWPWVEKMMVKAMGLDSEAPKGNRHELDASGLFKIFHEVKDKLKKPSLVFCFTHGDHPPPADEIKIYPKGNELNIVWAHKYPGWLGSVDGDHKLQLSKYLTDQIKKDIMQLMTEICHDVPKAVAQHGKLMNKCCFCGKPLSDPGSVNYGYGPVCAKTWGLPWG